MKHQRFARYVILSIFFFAGQIPMFAETTTLPAKSSDKKIEPEQFSRKGMEAVREGNYEQALEHFYQDALTVKRTALPERHASIAVGLNNLAELYRVTGRYRDAERMQREALAIFRETQPVRHQDVANSLHNLAFLLRTMGRHKRAEPLSRESLAIYRHTLPDGHERIATSLNNLAELLRITGRYSEAEPLYREALDIYRGALHERSEKLAHGLNNLALLLQTTGRYVEAEPLYREALAIYRAALPAGHVDIASGLNNLGELLRVTGRYIEAESVHREALIIFREAWPREHADNADGLYHLALLLQTMERYDEAEQLYREALRIYRKLLPEGHEAIALTLYHWAGILTNQARYVEADSMYREAYKISKLSGLPRLQWRIQGDLQGFYQAQNQPEQAIFYGIQAIETLQLSRSNNVGLERSVKQAFLKSVEGYYRDLAELLFDQGRLSEAQQVLAMLKEEELHQFMRGVSVLESFVQQSSYREQEALFNERHKGIQADLASIGVELRELKRKKKHFKLSEVEKSRLKQLNEAKKVATKHFDRYLDEIRDYFREKGGEGAIEFGGKKIGISSFNKLRAVLAKFEKMVVVLHFLVTDDRVHILLTGSEIPIHRDSHVSEKQLNKLIEEFRNDLKYPSEDARRSAQLLQNAKQLYQYLFKPIEKELDKLGAKVLMISLDGKLRYIPLAALHDGQQWLLQRYGVVLDTAAAQENLRADQSGGVEGGGSWREPRGEWILAAACRQH